MVSRPFTCEAESLPPKSRCRTWSKKNVRLILLAIVRSPPPKPREATTKRVGWDKIHAKRVQSESAHPGAKSGQLLLTGPETHKHIFMSGVDQAQPHSGN